MYCIVGKIVKNTNKVIKRWLEFVTKPCKSWNGDVVVDVRTPEFVADVRGGSMRNMNLVGEYTTSKKNFVSSITEIINGIIR